VAGQQLEIREEATSEGPFLVGVALADTAADLGHPSLEGLAAGLLARGHGLGAQEGVQSLPLGLYLALGQLQLPLHDAQGATRA